MSRTLARRSAHVDLHSLWSIQYVSHVSELNFPTSTWWRRPFLIFLQRHVIIFNGLSEIPSFVLTRASCISSINVIGIYLKYSSEVFDTLINLAQFLISTTSDVVGTCIRRIQLHKLIAILDSLVESAFLQKRRSSDEQSFFMCVVFLKLLGAHSYKIIYIKCLI
jgi:hypothetical protein